MGHRLDVDILKSHDSAALSVKMGGGADGKKRPEKDMGKHLQGVFKNKITLGANVCLFVYRLVCELSRAN